MTTQIAELNPIDMLNVTKRLCVILKEEIELIKEMKLGQLNQFNEEKLKLTSIMESYKEVLKNNPAIVRSIPKDILDEMRQVNREFEETIAQDGKQIIKAKKVHSIIMDAIKTVLENRSKRNAVYNQHGLLDAGKKKMNFLQPVSISESF
ncbi:MAG: hypothetical protein K0R98_1328 [Rickettsiaceae bacterium]|jgi:hypothetical protein|nr:hypothetical protein [Rickettsiaceae bacterium]